MQAGERGIELVITAGSSIAQGALPTSDLVTMTGNLIDNAIDAAAGSAHPKQVVVAVRVEADDLHIGVEDTGPGLIPDHLIAAMEHLGVSRPVVGVVVPTGYSFNLDGTAIYLTVASLFIAGAVNKALSIGSQISLLLFMILASKGAAGVTGAGLATLAGGLQSHRPELVNGVGLIVGIDRFMSEARALTNFAGNAIATVVIGSWTDELDRAKMHRVLAGDEPLDESNQTDDPSEVALEAPFDDAELVSSTRH